jgi:hypothetical protein
MMVDGIVQYAEEGGSRAPSYSTTTSSRPVQQPPAAHEQAGRWGNLLNYIYCISNKHALFREIVRHLKLLMYATVIHNHCQLFEGLV